MSPTGEGRPFGFFQIVVLVLSVYALVALLVDMVVPLKPETSKLIHRVDYVLCAIFFSDFVYQLARAENKWAYLRVGWIDLLASIPMIDALRWGRLFRVFRILRVIRSTQKLRRILRERDAVGGSVFLAAFMFVVLSSILMLTVETSDRSNIKTGGDALWWSITTMTTVGYGDLYSSHAIGPHRRRPPHAISPLTFLPPQIGHDRASSEPGEEMESVNIGLNGGNIIIEVEQSSAHRTTFTTYVIGWHIWGSLLLGLLVLFIVLRGRRRSH